MLGSQCDQLYCVPEGKTETDTLETNTQDGISASPLQLTDRHPLWNAAKCRSFFADGRPLLKGEYFKPLLYNHQATKIQNSNDENQIWVSHSHSMKTGLLFIGNYQCAFRRRCCTLAQNCTRVKKKQKKTQMNKTTTITFSILCGKSKVLVTEQKCNQNVRQDHWNILGRRSEWWRSQLCPSAAAASEIWSEFPVPGAPCRWRSYR